MNISSSTLSAVELNFQGLILISTHFSLRIAEVFVIKKLFEEHL